MFISLTLQFVVSHILSYPASNIILIFCFYFRLFCLQWSMPTIWNFYQLQKKIRWEEEVTVQKNKFWQQSLKWLFHPPTHPYQTKLFEYGIGRSASCFLFVLLQTGLVILLCQRQHHYVFFDFGDFFGLCKPVLALQFLP